MRRPREEDERAPESSHRAVVPKSDHVIVVTDGNADGLFTRLTAQFRVTMETVDHLSNIEAALRRAFRVK